MPMPCCYVRLMASCGVWLHRDTQLHVTDGAPRNELRRHKGAGGHNKALIGPRPHALLFIRPWGFSCGFLVGVSNWQLTGSGYLDSKSEGVDTLDSDFRLACPVHGTVGREGGLAP